MDETGLARNTRLQRTAGMLLLLAAALCAIAIIMIFVQDTIDTGQWAAFGFWVAFVVSLVVMAPLGALCLVSGVIIRNQRSQSRWPRVTGFVACGATLLFAGLALLQILTGGAHLLPKVAFSLVWGALALLSIATLDVLVRFQPRLVTPKNPSDPSGVVSV